MLTYGELFAGVGGFGLGFEAAGMECRWQVEIDPWCQQVLRRHWPDVPRYSDVRDVGAHNLEPVDVISFGSPCQDLSVAGSRAGLIGKRSGLFHEAVRVISELRPTYAVWENVPGALSSNGGRDFGAILDALAECGALDICWRIVDARFFGVPQRRRRLFLVASFRAEASAFEILVEPESCGGHPQTSGEAREATPAQTNGSTRSTGLASTLSGGGHADGVNLPGRRPTPDENLVVGSEVDDGMARPLVARATGYRMDIESENFVVSDPLSPREGKTYTNEGKNNFRTHNLIETASTVRVEYGEQSFRGDGSDTFIPIDAQSMAGVRRLTPRECERLMAFPDDWTRWTADGKEIPDSHRYRMCGNGVVSTVAEWIGWRLVAVDEQP